LDATKINVTDDESLENLNVTKTDIVTTEETALFRKDFTATSASKIDSDEQGSFILGAMFEKEISSEEENTTKSRLVMYSNDYFASSMPYSQYYSDGWIDLYNNKDVVLNTALYLTDSDVSITIRKSTNTEHFTMTDQEYTTILLIIFIVPVLIIILGIVVWQIRRRKK
jgi:ABC-2 type transport system permease protein